MIKRPEVQCPKCNSKEYGDYAPSSNHNTHKHFCKKCGFVFNTSSQQYESEYEYYHPYHCGRCHQIIKE